MLITADVTKNSAIVDGALYIACAYLAKVYEVDYREFSEAISCTNLNPIVVETMLGRQPAVRGYFSQIENVLSLAGLTTASYNWGNHWLNNKEILESRPGLYLLSDGRDGLLVAVENNFIPDADSSVPLGNITNFVWFIETSDARAIIDSQRFSKMKQHNMVRYPVMKQNCSEKLYDKYKKLIEAAEIAKAVDNIENAFKSLKTLV